MESQNPPPKISRFADFEIGRTSWSHSCNMESHEGEGSPPIRLGLELELGSGSTVYSKKCCGFTILQLQELQLQSLIYKYMEAGLPVPCHLLIPIWKSVASSFNGLDGDIHQLYPSFLGSGGLHMELRGGMDPEPGRCKRTDGKKWRCSKEALPDHKYCERHVHRGRLRSRKLVEASRRNSITSSTNANTNLSISLPLNNISNSSSSSTPTVTNPSPRFGFSPRTFLPGGIQKPEPSL
ncbi:Growth-regulating factor [Melia azedarach]|uniref:Growth-regulating factor n=1 Tax=Melia azedarach TaxID=155640 RepID=A0ACC1XRI5_MELAZ|nr:Growth-regulating factor [Melia azedarach]